MLATVLAPPSFPSPPLPLQNKQTNNFEGFLRHSTSFFKNVGFARGTFLSPLKEVSTLSASFEGIMSELCEVMINNPNILKTLCRPYNSWFSLPLENKPEAKLNLQLTDKSRNQFDLCLPNVTRKKQYQVTSSSAKSLV